MEIWALGTLEVSHDGHAVDVRGPLPRRLLALLALTPGLEVSADRLVDGLWGAAAPPAATTTLHSHVARLRRDLAVPDLVRTGRGGYLLAVEPEDIDTFVLQRNYDRGRDALIEGRPEEASEVLTAALGQWRGIPYVEFPDCPILEAEAERLSALRLDVLEGRISADLARPGIALPVAELEALVRWHPLREAFWALLMCAQYRVGRQGDALASYQRARRVIGGELGVDPGPALQELERLILAQDPSLEAAGMSALLSASDAPAPYAEQVPLLERAELLASLTDLQSDALAGSGRLALVRGEAGAGKSALVRTWSGSLSATTRVLQGACDPLSSPRPLGPLVDVAPYLDADVGDMLRSGERDGLFAAVLAALDVGGPVVWIIEDLHWSDMSTLDLVRFLARRVEGTHILLVVTYRDEHLGPSDPLRVMLGDITSQPAVRRLEVPMLSAAAVTELVGGTGLDADALYRETGGNAFFVTEVVAAGGDGLPATVQDAVLARVQRLSPQARLALESAAVIGSRVEPSLLHVMPAVTADTVDECVTCGMLRFTAPSYAFRHELVRQAVLSGITPGRLGALHWQVLDRLRDIPMSPRPLARLAEHADMAGDGPAILEFAIAAGDTAGSLGSHREAAFQYGRAMPYVELLGLDERIALLGKRAMECQIADQHEEAIAAWRQALELLRGTGRDLEIVDALLGLDQSYYTIGDNTPGSAFIDEAYELLEGTGPSRALALTLAGRGLHHLRASENEAAIPWMEQALQMARELDDVEIVARVDRCLGLTRFLQGDSADGSALVAEGLRLAIDNDFQDQAASAFQTSASLAWLQFDLAEAFERFEDARRYAHEHDLTGHLMCILASQITLRLELGEWDDALTEANDLLYVRNTGRASRIEPLIGIGLVAARRGDRDTAWARLDEARDYISKSQTLGYQGFVALARGEVHLLDGNLEAIRTEVMPWYEEAARLDDVEVIGDLALLVWRAQLIEGPPPGVREPHLLSMTGRPRDAAAQWAAYGDPYRAAWALLDSEDQVDLREARARFGQLGATVLVQRCDAKLRSIGARVPRGARPSTRANVGGLTDREVEVLELLDEGLRNAEIAGRLHLSEKTVEHHVSAVLAKLGASSRLEAVRRARDLVAAG